MSSHPEMALSIIPVVFGLAIIAPRNSRVFQGATATGITAPTLSLLSHLEENRLRLYLRVLAMQDKVDCLRGQIEALVRRANDRPINRIRRWLTGPLGRSVI